MYFDQRRQSCDTKPTLSRMSTADDNRKTGLVLEGNSFRPSSLHYTLSSIQGHVNTVSHERNEDSLHVSPLQLALREDASDATGFLVHAAGESCRVALLNTHWPKGGGKHEPTCGPLLLSSTCTSDRLVCSNWKPGTIRTIVSYHPRLYVCENI
jgi:hypothetical protein